MRQGAMDRPTPPATNQSKKGQTCGDFALASQRDRQVGGATESTVHATGQHEFEKAHAHPVLFLQSGAYSPASIDVHIKANHKHHNSNN